jgi:hypothetical protein
MGARDTEEQLEAALEDTVRMEQEIAGLRALLGRIGDHVREIPEPARDGRDDDYHFGRGLLAQEILALVDTAGGRPDVSPLSHIYVGGVRQTWQQVAIDREAKLLAAEPLLTMVADLSRNEHGRHEGDVDGDAPSQGNPVLRPGMLIGFSIHGTHAYVVPERGRLHDPAAWRRPLGQ